MTIRLRRTVRYRGTRLHGCRPHNGPAVFAASVARASSATIRFGTVGHARVWRYNGIIRGFVNGDDSGEVVNISHSVPFSIHEVDRLGSGDTCGSIPHSRGLFSIPSGYLMNLPVPTGWARSMTPHGHSSYSLSLISSSPARTSFRVGR